MAVWLLLALTADPAPGGSSTIQGLSLDAAVSTGIFGGALTVDLGARSTGTRAFANRRWLLQWQGEFAVLAGLVAYEYPFYPLNGVRAQGEGDAVFRITPDKALSAALDFGAATEAAAVGAIGIARVNNLDGLGGIFANLGWRAGGGGAWLFARHALVFTVDAEMELDAGQANLPTRLFFGAALHARYDLLDSLVAVGTAYLGVALANDDNALGLSQQTNRWLLSVNVTKKFGKHFFADGGIVVSRDQTNSTYVSGSRFASAAPVAARLGLGGGYSF